MRDRHSIQKGKAVGAGVRGWEVCVWAGGGGGGGGTAALACGRRTTGEDEMLSFVYL